MSSSRDGCRTCNVPFTDEHVAIHATIVDGLFQRTGGIKCDDDFETHYGDKLCLGCLRCMVSTNLNDDEMCYYSCVNCRSVFCCTCVAEQGLITGQNMTVVGNCLGCRHGVKFDWVWRG